MREYVLQGLLFVAVVGLTLLVLRWLLRLRQAVNKRLVDEDAEDSGDALLGGLADRLADPADVDPTAHGSLPEELRDAGYYHGASLARYTVLRGLFILAPLFAVAVAALVAPRPWIPTLAVAGLVAGVLGFSVPRVYLGWRARYRSRQIERGLPVAVDLLSLGLSAGQTMQASLYRVAQEVRNTYPVLTEELEIVTRQAELRNLPHALKLFADRCRVVEVRNLAILLSQAERLGTDVTAALLEFSGHFRVTLRQRAEGQANRASFWMVFPSIFCLWIPAAVILLAPVVMEFRKQREEARAIMEDVRKNIQEANRDAAARLRQLNQPRPGRR